MPDSNQEDCDSRGQQAEIVYIVSRSEHSC